jgi:CRISPR-associated protein Cas2
MAEPRHWYLVMYDVSNERTLKSVHKLLTGWGSPVQYSVFRVRCTSRESERLRWELTKLIDTEDRLMFVRLCESCASRVTVQGSQLDPFPSEQPPFRVL